MVNVLFTYPPGESDPAKRFPIVGELQLTTVASVKVKKVQHKVCGGGIACCQGLSPHEVLRAWEGGRSNQEAHETLLKSVCKSE